MMIPLWEHWFPLIVAAGFGAAKLGACALSTTVGFFGVHEQWQGSAVWLSAGRVVGQRGERRGRHDA